MIPIHCRNVNSRAIGLGLGAIGTGTKISRGLSEPAELGSEFIDMGYLVRKAKMVRRGGR
jgi:hypothetical protein